MLERLGLVGRSFSNVVFVGVAVVVCFAASACSGSVSTTSEETTTAEATTAEGSAADVAAAAERAMKKNYLKAVLVRVTQNILGKALPAITGTPLDELIRERISEPLGMEATESHQTAEISEP